MRGLRAAEQTPAGVRRDLRHRAGGKMLAGGGPMTTTETGGIGEAVGDTALIVPSSSPNAIAAALDHALTMPEADRVVMAEQARSHALQFDRLIVFERLLARVPAVQERRLTPAGG